MSKLCCKIGVIYEIGNPKLFFDQSALRDDLYSMCLDFLIREKRYKSIEILLSKGYPLFTLASGSCHWAAGFSEHVEMLKEQTKSATTQDKKRIESILDDAYIATLSNGVSSYYRKKDNVLVVSPLNELFTIANKLIKDLE